MLKKLQIKNFKGWKDTGVIEMAPITLLFGPNSSGKSSIGQFLMLLKQTAQSADQKAVFNFGEKNTAVHLGSYQDMVYRHDLKNKIEFHYEWSLSKKLEIKDPSSPSEEIIRGDRLRFYAEIGLGANGKQTPMLYRFQYHLKKEKDRSIQQLLIGMQYEPDTKPEYIVCHYEKFGSVIRLPMSQRSLSPPTRFYRFPSEVPVDYRSTGFAPTLNREHEKLFKSIYYLGPLRSRTERSYSLPKNTPESVGYDGEHTVAAILAACKRDRQPGSGARKPAKHLEATIATKLKDMGLAEEFKTKLIAAKEQRYEVKVRAKGSKTLVDLCDAGFGISQVLPVLVQCFYAPPDSTIIIDKPELYLHPSAQSALADVMIDAINAKEDGANRNIQLIIETHSEHFLRRLQRRIAEDRIARDKISAYFANTTKTPAILDKLEVDCYGSITNWPDQFFGDEMGDILKQSKAAIKKQKQQKARESA